MQTFMQEILSNHFSDGIGILLGWTGPLGCRGDELRRDLGRRWDRALLVFSTSLRDG